MNYQLKVYGIHPTTSTEILVIEQDFDDTTLLKVTTTLSLYALNNDSITRILITREGE